MLMRIKSRYLLLCLSLTWFCGCSVASVGSKFFEGDIPTRNARLEGYPIEQQWEIYLYGNQTIHPPATGLAIVLAGRGEPMLKYILGRLEMAKSDLDYRDSMRVFQMMERKGSYHICADESALAKIRANQDRIRNIEWRRVYGDMLGELCRSKPLTPPPPTVPPSPASRF